MKANKHTKTRIGPDARGVVSIHCSCGWAIGAMVSPDKEPEGERFLEVNWQDHLYCEGQAGQEQAKADYGEFLSSIAELETEDLEVLLSALEAVPTQRSILLFDTFARELERRKGG